MEKNNGIMIFKDIFEYYKEGDLNEKGFCELMMLIYETKWGVEPDINTIQDRMCKTIWKGLRYSIKKSVRNAKYQNNKSTLQEVKPIEFDLPKIENYNNGNIQENCQIVENENKADLIPSNPIGDNLYQPEVKSGSNSPKTSNTKVLEKEEGLDKFLTEYKFRIEDIIDAYNSGSPLKITKQGDGGLKEILNTYYGRKYKEDIIRIIQNKTQYKITA